MMVKFAKPMAHVRRFAFSKQGDKTFIIVHAGASKIKICFLFCIENDKPIYFQIGFSFSFDAVIMIPKQYVFSSDPFIEFYAICKQLTKQFWKDHTHYFDVMIDVSVFLTSILEQLDLVCPDDKGFRFVSMNVVKRYTKVSHWLDLAGLVIYSASKEFDDVMNKNYEIFLDLNKKARRIQRNGKRIKPL